MSILVFGSLNMDLVVRSPRLPQPGETLTGYRWNAVPGGKGANQAVAVARLGGSAQMIGRVGSDEFGHNLIASLQATGVNCDRIEIDSFIHSGIALITVDDAGQNQILVIPGANGNVATLDWLEQLSHTQALLLQLEIPLDAVITAAQAAHQAGIWVILDPAPDRSDLPGELYSYIDVLTPNQIEAGQLVGNPIRTIEDALEAAQILQRRGSRQVIIKLGGLGAVCVTQQSSFHLPAFPVQAIDTVAAGDAFNGGLAVALVEGKSWQEAVIFASATAALAVTQGGAQSSMPNREAVEEFLRDRHLC